MDSRVNTRIGIHSGLNPIKNARVIEPKEMTKIVQLTRFVILCVCVVCSSCFFAD